MPRELLPAEITALNLIQSYPCADSPGCRASGGMVHMDDGRSLTPAETEVEAVDMIRAAAVARGKRELAALTPEEAHRLTVALTSAYGPAAALPYLRLIRRVTMIR